jgi:hypothetical protein
MRTHLLLAITALLMVPITASAQVDPASLALFVQRTADASGFGVPVQVTIGALPPGWKAPTPLPTGAPVLGSVMNNARSVTIYYHPALVRNVYEAFVAQLRSAGFQPSPQMMGIGGFSFSGTIEPRLTAFCRGTQNISIVVAPNRPDDLRVTIPQASPAFGACATPRSQKLITPLPAFVAPAGTTLMPMGATSAGGYSAGGQISSTSSAALITGNVPVSSVLRSFLTQLRHAGWQVTNAVQGRDSAIAAFRIDRNRLHWRGSLVVYRTDTPQTLAAHVDASGGVLTTEQIATTSAPLPWIPMHASKSDEPSLLELMRRLATDNIVTMRSPTLRMSALMAQGYSG